MAKFNRASNGQFRPEPDGKTYEGGAGFSRDEKTELFLLGVVNMVGEQTFYETAPERDNRFKTLVHSIAVSDPEWLLRFVKWLRQEANMRTASVVAGVEGAAGRLMSGKAGYSRQLVSAGIARADEPGEALAYWFSTYGRSVPSAVKRGIGDAIIRLGSEFNYLKWDSDNRGFSFADVLRITHAGDRKSSAQKLRGEWQHDLFGHVVKKSYEPDTVIPESLEMLSRRQVLMSMPVNERRSVLEDPDLLKRAGITWEALAGWLQGPMDARAWEAIIPSMGYMALLRNLRNFDKAGVSDEVAEGVAKRLIDPDQVARSRQFPMRFLSAYRAASDSLRWAYPVEKALQLSLSNVPELAGRTLILVDRSGSMWSPLSERSDLTRADAAAIFGAALAMRSENADLVEFDNNHRKIDLRRGTSLLKAVNKFAGGGGTSTTRAVAENFKDHDRVVILTDEQHGGGWGYSYWGGGSQYSGHTPDEFVPKNVPMYTWNLAGYKTGHSPITGNRYTFGGLTDQGFRLIQMVESGAKLVDSFDM